MKNEIINGIILKALKLKTATKLSSQEESILFDHGLELVLAEDHNMSAQGYMLVSHTQNGNELVISKDYDNKNGLYGNNRNIANSKNIKKIDLYGFLDKHTDAKVGYHRQEYNTKRWSFVCNVEDTLVQKYIKLTEKSGMIDYYENEVAELAEKMKSAQESLDAYMGIYDSNVGKANNLVQDRKEQIAERRGN